VVCITSPSYEGLIAELEPIASFCFENNVRLLVDGAHGSILPFLRESALKTASDYGVLSGIGMKGVDIVVNSIHKGAGGMSQTSIIHLNKTSPLAAKKVEGAINLTCTTSPSNILLASIEEVIHNNFDPTIGLAMLKDAI